MVSGDIISNLNSDNNIFVTLFGIKLPLPEASRADDKQRHILNHMIKHFTGEQTIYFFSNVQRIRNICKHPVAVSNKWSNEIIPSPPSEERKCLTKQPAGRAWACPDCQQGNLQRTANPLFPSLEGSQVNNNTPPWLKPKSTLQNITVFHTRWQKASVRLPCPLNISRALILLLPSFAVTLNLPDSPLTTLTTPGLCAAKQ